MSGYLDGVVEVVKYITLSKCKHYFSFEERISLGWSRVRIIYGCAFWRLNLLFDYFNCIPHMVVKGPGPTNWINSIGGGGTAYCL